MKQTWTPPTNRSGICRLRFGSIQADFIHEEGRCEITTNKEFKLELKGRSYSVQKGSQVIQS